MFLLNVLLLIVYLSSVICGLLERPSNIPCKLDDVKCITDATEWIISSSIQGIPELGIQSLDPLYHEVIEVNLGFVKYKLLKTHIEGIKTCKVNKASVNSNATSMHMELLCRRTHMDGEYDIEGEILRYPIKGKGIFKVDTTNYLCLYDTSLSYYKQNGKLYANHKSSNFKCELLGEMDLDLSTIDGNEKKMTDTVLNIIKLAKDNGKLFSSLLDYPIHSRNTENIVKSLNKRLEAIPITEILQVGEKL